MIKPSPRRVFLVDDHPLLRQGITHALHRDGRFNVCGEAGSLREALRSIPEAEPHMVVVDISLTDGSGFDLIPSLQSSMPDLKYMVISMHGESEFVQQAIRIGAQGYFHKSDNIKNLCEGIHQIFNGSLFVSSNITNALVRGFIEEQRARYNLGQLSPREREVLRMLGTGHSRSEIAEAFNISVKTVDSHCERIKSKWKIPSTRDLSHIAHQIHKRIPPVS